MPFTGTLTKSALGIKSNAYGDEPTRYNNINLNPDGFIMPDTRRQQFSNFITCEPIDTSKSLYLTIRKVRLYGTRYDEITKRFYYRESTKAGKYQINFDSKINQSAVTNTTEEINFTPTNVGDADEYIQLKTIMGYLGTTRLPGIVLSNVSLCGVDLKTFTINETKNISYIGKTDLIDNVGMIACELNTSRLTPFIDIRIIETSPPPFSKNSSSLMTYFSGNKSHEFEFMCDHVTDSTNPDIISVLYGANIARIVFEPIKGSEKIINTETGEGTIQTQDMYIYIYNVNYSTVGSPGVIKTSSIKCLLHNSTPITLPVYFIYEKFVVDTNKVDEDIIFADNGTNVNEYLPHSSNIKCGFEIFKNARIKFSKNFLLGVWCDDTTPEYGARYCFQLSRGVVDSRPSFDSSVPNKFDIFITGQAYAEHLLNFVGKNNEKLNWLAMGFVGYENLSYGMPYQSQATVVGRDILVNIMVNENNQMTTKQITISELYDMIQRQKVNDLEQRLHALEVACKHMKRNVDDDENPVEFENLMEIKDQYSVL